MKGLRPPEPSSSAVVLDVKRDGAALEFGEEHVHETAYDMSVQHPRSWLNSASSLLRASRAVARQSAIDNGAWKTWVARMKAHQLPSDSPSPSLSAIVNQAVFLAALATENALKALIVAKTPVAPAVLPTGRQSKEIKGHELADLAAKANLTPANDDERSALEGGQLIIAGFGRYQVMTEAKHTPARYTLRPQAALDAYARLVMRCVEEVAQTLYRSGTVALPATPEGFVDQFKKESGGVSPAWDGEELVALGDPVIMVPLKNA